MFIRCNIIIKFHNVFIEPFSCKSAFTTVKYKVGHSDAWRYILPGNLFELKINVQNRVTAINKLSQLSNVTYPANKLRKFKFRVQIVVCSMDLADCYPVSSS